MTARLVRSEMRKMRRPLFAWTAALVVGIVTVLAWGGQSSTPQLVSESEILEGQSPTPCSAYPLPDGPDCAERQQIEQRAVQKVVDQLHAGIEEARIFRNPVYVGHMAAGLMASFLGAVALLLLTAGHIAQEWSGGTIRPLLTHEGRRWRILAAKVLSLWLVGVGLVLACWAVLAFMVPALNRAFPIPGRRISAGAAWASVLPEVLRAAVVMAAFVLLGAVAAVVTRNPLVTFFSSSGFVVLSFVASGYRPLTRWTLTYWVSGWMGFKTQHLDPVTDHMWIRFFPSGVPEPSPVLGGLGLAVFMVVCPGVALLWFQRRDVTV
jgi:ABC-type transport system involved in multi-copper enzyme maturation permease subunit